MRKVNDILFAFGRVPIESSMPIILLRKERLYRKVIVGVGIASFILGVYCSYKYFKRKETKNLERYNQNENNVIGDVYENQSERHNLDPELSRSEKRQERYLRFQKRDKGQF